MAFQDHFSSHSGQYARFRPQYPESLFDSVAALLSPEQRICAWDCATGNGQAARPLAARFKQVIASDGSARQIEQALSCAGVEYRVFTAEEPDLEDDSIDLVTVAQAFHWLRLPQFYTALRRVVRRHGWLAVWGYGLNSIDPLIDELVLHFYRNTVGPFWPPDRRHIENGYRALDFPFAEVAMDQPQIELFMDLADFLGYLGTWSAVVRYREIKGQNPIDEIVEPLRSLWGDAQRRCVRWQIFLRAGRVHGLPGA
ncbi:MAG: class I SAM-dependent methyltransferase [Leptospirales bacterium]|nr:class I SAM-dependent methyltransferase [Leptospirales bacterium]